MTSGQRADDVATATSGSTRTARLSAWVAVLALLGGLAVAPPWARYDDVPEGFAARLISGDLERLEEQDWVGVREGELVPDDTTVRTTDGAQLSVGQGTIGLGRDSRATLGDTYVVETGSLLVESPDASRTVEVGATRAEGRGVWRIDAMPTERFGVYSGGVSVQVAESGGLGAELLDQIALLAGRLPERALPLRYSEDDPWDARLLAPAIAADRQVAQLERALAAEYGQDPREAEFYTSFGPAEVASSLETEDALDAPAPEGIIHVAVAALLAERRALRAEVAVARTVGSRRDGATWGLILQRYDLDAGDLLAATGEALEQAAETPPPPPPTEASDEDPDGTGDEPVAPPPPGGEPDPPPTPSPTPSPSPTEPDDPVSEVVDEVEEKVDDLVDLLPIDPPPAVTDPLDEVVDGLLRDEDEDGLGGL